MLLVLLVTLWAAVTQPLFSAHSSSTNVAVEPARLERHVRMLSEDLVPRDWQHAENLGRAAAYVRREFSQTQATVSEQAFEMDGRTYRNIIALFKPRATAPSNTERIVVGAHYDAHGEFPAADDNSSGVAGLIELARLLDRVNVPITIELVAYTLEETRRPLRFETGGQYNGSTVHAAALRREGMPVRLMISLEMIGFFSDAEDSQSYPSPVLRWVYPTRGNFIVIAGRFQEGLAVRRLKRAMRAASPLPVYSFSAPSSTAGIDRSDHASYWEQGYPAVMISDTAFYRNPNYHTAQDTADTLDYRRMAMVVQGTYQAVLEYAQSAASGN